jgi:hypothetical protein
MTATPEANARAVANGVLYIVQFDPQLDDAVVERIARQLIERPLFGQPLSVTVAGLRLALASSEDVTGHLPQPHDEAASRSFLTRLVERLRGSV